MINGLAILCTDCSGRPRVEDLEQDDANRIIGGPGAFVITADGPRSFAWPSDASWFWKSPIWPVEDSMYEQQSGNDRPDRHVLLIFRPLITLR